MNVFFANGVIIAVCLASVFGVLKSFCICARCVFCSLASNWFCIFFLVGYRWFLLCRYRVGAGECSYLGQVSHIVFQYIDLCAKATLYYLFCSVGCS